MRLKERTVRIKWKRAEKKAKQTMLKKLLLLLIRFYQVAISPNFGRHCNFMPTCSQYAYIAITRFGAIKGTYLAVRRLLKCHPFHEGGYDPVPEKKEK